MNRLQRHAAPYAAVYVPAGYERPGLHRVKVVLRVRLHPSRDRHGDAGHPDVLFVHGIGQVHGPVVRHRPRLQAADVVGAAVPPEAPVALLRHLAVDAEHVFEFNAVVAGHDRQRPAVAGIRVGIVAQGIAAVGGALAPHLAAAHHQRRRHLHRRPRLAAVLADGHAGLLPQTHQTTVRQLVIVEGLARPADGEEVLVGAVAVLLPPLQRGQLIRQQTVHRRHKARVLAVLVVGETAGLPVVAAAGAVQRHIHRAEGAGRDKFPAPCGQCRCPCRAW